MSSSSMSLRVVRRDTYPRRTDPSHRRSHRWGLRERPARDVTAAGLVGLGAAAGQLVLAGGGRVVLARGEVLALAVRAGIGLQRAGVVERVGNVGIGDGHGL